MQLTIAVDVLGGDKAPEVVLDGIAAALTHDSELRVIGTGPDKLVKPFEAEHDRFLACPTTESISMGEHPASAVRTKKDSSLVVAARLVKEGKAQGFFSAGNTGACLAAGILVMGRKKSLKRPALATIVPSPAKPVVLCDVGANADCKPEYLVQFAQMASLYARKMLSVKNPQVALLNIGEEEEKGSQFAQAAHQLLKEKLDNFAGNAEGRDVVGGTFDVVVCDGFTGNVCLKTIEGTAKVLFSSLKEQMMSSTKSKLAGLMLKKDLKKLASRLDPDKTGGAPLLGCEGACIVGHGSSSAAAVTNGILLAADYVRSGISDEIGSLQDQ